MKPFDYLSPTRCRRRESLERHRARTGGCWRGDGPTVALPAMVTSRPTSSSTLKRVRRIRRGIAATTAGAAAFPRDRDQ